MVAECIYKMILYFDGDVKRINHSLKVHDFARTISGIETLSEKERLVVELSAILHDIGIKEAERKYNSSEPKYQHIEGPAVAEKLLGEIGVEKSVIDRVCFIIGNHHNYNKIDGTDFQIIVEADFFVNIFEGGMEPDSIKSVKNKYFKTQTGVKILESMYRV